MILFFRTKLLKILMRLVEPNLTHRNDKSEREFLRRLDNNEGFKSYVAVRSLYILKEMGQCLPEKDYWIAIGQRKELLLLAARAKETKDNIDKEHDGKSKDINYKEK